MSGCNCSFLVETGYFIEWMTATGLANSLNTFENRNNCKCLFKRNRVPLKILDHCKWSPKIMVVALKCMAVSVPLK